MELKTKIRRSSDINGILLIAFEVLVLGGVQLLLAPVTSLFAEEGSDSYETVYSLIAFIMQYFIGVGIPLLIFYRTSAGKELGEKTPLFAKPQMSWGWIIKFIFISFFFIYSVNYFFNFLTTMIQRLLDVEFSAVDFYADETFLSRLTNVIAMMFLAPFFEELLFRGTFVRNSARYGGAFYSDYSYMEIVNCTFKSNSAYQGGAVYVTNNAATIIDCVFQNNKATNYGGAIYSYSSTSRTIWCRFSGNTASSSSYANTYKCSSYSPTFTFASNPLEVHYPNVAVPINISYSYKYYQYDRVYNFNGINVTLKIFNYTNYNQIGTNYAVSGSLWNNSLDLGKYSISLSATAYGFSVSSSFTYIKMGYLTVINLSSQTLNVSSSVFYVVRGNETYLAATLTDEAGHPLGGKYIKLTRTNYYTKRYQTDENGTVMLPLHTFELPEYSGSTYYLALQSEQSGLYDPSSPVGFNLCIRKADVNIDLIQSASIFFYETLNITAEISDELGNVLNNTAVEVSFNGDDKQITTDKNGRITIEIPNMEPDRYVLSITCPESDSYRHSTKNIDVNVMKHEATFASSNVSAFCNEGKIVASLADELGNPVADCNVTLIIADFNETLKTNGNGQVEFDLDGWDASRVTDMRCFFQGCTSLTDIDLSWCDTSNVENMGSMFDGCSSLQHINFTNVDTSSVTNMGSMFKGCSSLIELDLSGFDTTNVTQMLYMFNGCSSLRRVCVSFMWTTANVTSDYAMFSGCNVLMGQDGTTYPAGDGKTYARIDNLPSEPGYFTYKAAPTQP